MEKSRKRRRPAKAKPVKEVKRTSHMKGKKIDKENRKPDDPKLGRPFKYGEETEKHTVTLSLRKGTMDNLLEDMELTSKAKAITRLIDNRLDGEEG